jgi:hypothetical protein
VQQQEHPVTFCSKGKGSFVSCVCVWWSFIDELGTYIASIIVLARPSLRLQLTRTRLLLSNST